MNIGTGFIIVIEVYNISFSMILFIASICIAFMIYSLHFHFLKLTSFDYKTLEMKNIR